MSSVKLVRETYLSVSYGNRTVGIGVRTKDIGCTIGTELTWWPTGERIAAYRPGTRHAGYAEELSAELVSAALAKVPTGLGDIAFGKALIDSIRQHKDVVSRPWDPDYVDEEMY